MALRLSKKDIQKLIARGRISGQALETARAATQNAPGDAKQNAVIRTIVRGGRRADLGDVYFRSAWESNYARFLNWQQNAGIEIERWEFEPDEFEFIGYRRGVRFYKPDFKIWTLDGKIVYHEIKGFMDSKSRTKLKRMKKCFPHVEIVVIDRPAYRAIKDQFSKLIPNWE